MKTVAATAPREHRRDAAPVLVVTAVGIVLSLFPSPGSAQQYERWFPEVEPFPALIAAPREVQFRGSFVFADRDREPGFDGRNLEAEVAIGHRVRVVRLDSGSRPDRMATWGLEVGIFSRFFMEAATKDLIDVDYRVSLPFEFRFDVWQLRIGYRHVSSHIGDDYLQRFPAMVEQASKDGFEALVARTLPHEVRLYAGGDINFHINPGMPRYELRGGFEWDPASGASDVWPFFAGDLYYTSLTEEAAGTVTAGIGLRLGARAIRLEARAHAGPTPMAQLRGAHETFAGLGLRIEL